MKDRKKATIDKQLDYLERCIQTAIEITAKNERMLKWLVIYSKYHDPAEYVMAKNNAGISGIEFPDMSDVFNEGT